MVTFILESRWARTTLLAGALLLSACVGARKTPETAGTARLKDSAPEKAAAMRAANSDLHLEDEDARWAITAAQERKRARDEQKREAASKQTLNEYPPKVTMPGPNFP
jgi:hypothetical protein